jgi:hypothetical protein
MKLTIGEKVVVVSEPLTEEPWRGILNKHENLNTEIVEI